MKQILLIAILLLLTLTSKSQIEYVAVCNPTTEKVEIYRVKDTTDKGLVLLKNKLPNKQIAQRWVKANHPDGTCTGRENSNLIRPSIPSNAGRASSSENQVMEVPEKKVSHFYKNYRLFSYGTTAFNLEDLPLFEVRESQGQYFGFRFQKGERMQIGFSVSYLSYGKVVSYDDGPMQEPTVKNWSNVDLSWFLSSPIELHRKSGQIWLLPQAGIGLSLQNLQRIENRDIDVELSDKAIFYYEAKVGIELYHVHFAVGYQGITSNAFKDTPDFSFRGIVLSGGLAF